MITDKRLIARRCIGFCFVMGVFSVDLYATGLFGGGERALAVARSIVLPGLPFLEWQLPLGLLMMGIAITSVFVWLRWGVDWLPVLVVTISVSIAAFVMPLHHTSSAGDGLRHGEHIHHHQTDIRAPAGLLVEPAESLRVVKASHEFTIVLVVFAFIARLRLLFDRIPGTARLQQNLLPDSLLFPAVDVARAAALTLLAKSGGNVAAESLKRPELLARAARVNAWARFRFRRDPLSGAHAPLRAALSMAGLLNATRIQAFRDEARAGLVGVPASEPTWIRPLDGMLAALALDALGETGCAERWRTSFRQRFALRHGRRAAALHVPSMLSMGTAPAWEQATSSALGFWKGWLGAEDWAHLRPRCLGKAASAARDPDSLRLVAAGKLWACLTNDSEALEILGRRTVDGDRVAAALEHLALTIPATRDGTDQRRTTGTAAIPLS